MPTVDATNSYVTESEAATYFGERLYVTTWTDASEEDQQKALLMARRLLDVYMIWKGNPVDKDQPLAWPREGCPGVTSDVIPPTVKAAQLELALLLLGKDLTALPDTAGFTSLQVDTIKLEVAANDRTKIVPAPIAAMLSPLGFLKGEQPFFNVVR